jgi:S-formylglutathione hydrolase FrmB
MKKVQLILRGVFLLLIFVGPVYTQRDPPTGEGELKSALLGRTVSYQVLYPVKYQSPENREKRFPVIYLLHGLSGHSTDWLEKTKIALYATHYDLFIVMVEGGNGWYTDSATVPADKYESYILRELIPDVEKRFRVSTQREGRAIAGLSMGGYGAIKFGLKHPEMFAMAASMSGAFGAASWTEKEHKDPGVIRDSVLQTFGPAGSPTRAANDVPKLVREISAKKIAPLPYFYFDCGTEDFLFSDNRELASLFVELKIPHEYRQLPGTHAWSYWDAQVQEILKLAAQKLRK